MEKADAEGLDDALRKVALGFSLEEVTEEYGEVDGKLKLLKRKRTKKQIPPDLKAVQLLIGERADDYSRFSDEQLEQEKIRLLSQLKEWEDGGQVLVEKEKPKRKPRVKKQEKEAEEQSA